MSYASLNDRPLFTTDTNKPIHAFNTSTNPTISINNSSISNIINNSSISKIINRISCNNNYNISYFTTTTTPQVVVVSVEYPNTKTNSCNPQQHLTPIPRLRLNPTLHLYCIGCHLKVSLQREDYFVELALLSY